MSEPSTESDLSLSFFSNPFTSTFIIYHQQSESDLPFQIHSVHEKLGGGFKYFFFKFHPYYLGKNITHF